MVRLLILGGALAALAASGAGLTASAALAGQAASDPAISRTEAIQIEPPAKDGGERPPRAFLDIGERTAAPPLPRTSLTEVGDDPIARGPGNAPASQISAPSQGGSGMAQLSSADLEATLAQLSAAERRVLLQAIEGSDICDSPPEVAAILTLCRNRLETRAGEFAALSEAPLTSEDRLMRGDFDATAAPSLERVVERLARAGASSGDPSNQEIAAVALGASSAVPPTTDPADPAAAAGLSQETQVFIQSLINQLAGGTP
jgi:hypothetical protein